MALAVELYFDPGSEEAIEALRSALRAERGVPETEPVNGRPHVSLSVVETDDGEALAEVTAAFARAAPQISLRLGALASFASDQGVLYLAPVPTLELLEAHSRFHAALTAADFDSRTHYRPGSWIPHCTLELGLSAPLLAAAFDASWRSFAPFDGWLVEVGVVSFPPPRPLLVAPLVGHD